MSEFTFRKFPIDIDWGFKAYLIQKLFQVQNGLCHPYHKCSNTYWSFEKFYELEPHLGLEYFWNIWNSSSKIGAVGLNFKPCFFSANILCIINVSKLHEQILDSAVNKDMNQRTELLLQQFALAIKHRNQLFVINGVLILLCKWSICQTV